MSEKKKLGFSNISLTDANPRNQFDVKEGKIGELLRLGSNVAGGVRVSGGEFSGFGGDCGGEGRVVGSGAGRFSSSAIEECSSQSFFF